MDEWVDEWMNEPVTGHLKHILDGNGDRPVRHTRRRGTGRWASRVSNRAAAGRRLEDAWIEDFQHKD